MKWEKARSKREFYPYELILCQICGSLGVFIKMSVTASQSKDPADTFCQETYYRVPSTVPSPIFQPSPDECTADHLHLTTGHPSSIQTTPREPSSQHMVHWSPMPPQAQQCGFVHPQVGVGAQPAHLRPPHRLPPFPQYLTHTHTRLGSFQYDTLEMRVCVCLCLLFGAGLQLSGFDLRANTQAGSNKRRVPPRALNT